MLVESVSLRDFRNHHVTEVELAEGSNVLVGPNGAGKTNLLEGIYFGLSGHSCRTQDDRQVVRFGAGRARAEVATRNGAGRHLFEVGYEPGEPKRLRVDGVALPRLIDHDGRPPLAVFLPDRLELVKGRPGVRRAHLDALVAALWPTRRQTRTAYLRVLAQRNALLGRIRAETALADQLDAWDAEAACHGFALMCQRQEAVAAITEPFGRLAEELGLGSEAAVAYRPRSKASSEQELREELELRRRQDLERGFSGHGPQRDDLAIRLAGRSLRSYGSQGEQRLALLALLLAERDALERQLDGGCVLLLDDVMSELDSAHRERLVELLQRGGQWLVTTTDLAQVPGLAKAGGDGVVLRVEAGSAAKAA